MGRNKKPSSNYTSSNYTSSNYTSSSSSVQASGRAVYKEVHPSASSRAVYKEVRPSASSSRPANKEVVGVDNLYYSYAKASMIGPEGIERLCSDLGVNHTDVRILMLAWKMQAQKQGYFTLEEWRKGLKALRADSITTLKKALPDLQMEVYRSSNLVEFYTYAFQYCLTEDKQKSIDIECICQLLELVLRSKFRHQVEAFVKYLKIQVDYKVINMDQWMGFYRFCSEISFPDFKNYDEESSLPLILDNFVEWMKSKQT